MTLGKLPKLQHGGNTIPQSRRNTDRHIIRRGGLTGHWLVDDTHTGLVVDRFPAGEKHRAVARADELNQGET